MQISVSFTPSGVERCPRRVFVISGDKAAPSAYLLGIGVIGSRAGRAATGSLRAEDTPLFLKIWFLGLPKQCSLLLLIGANLFGHHSLNLTSPPILLLLPVNYNKTWNGMAAQARRGKGGKTKNTIRSNPEEPFLCALCLCCSSFCVVASSDVGIFPH